MKLSFICAILLFGANGVAHAAEARKPTTNAIAFPIPNYGPSGCDETDAGIWSLNLTPAQRRKANERCYGRELLNQIRKGLETNVVAAEALAKRWKAALDNDVFPYACSFTGEMLVIAAESRAKALSSPTSESLIDSIEKAQTLGEEIGKCEHFIVDYLAEKIWESMSPAQLKTMRDRHRR